jgi:hypothetical protein
MCTESPKSWELMACSNYLFRILFMKFQARLETAVHAIENVLQYCWVNGDSTLHTHRCENLRS